MQSSSKLVIPNKVWILLILLLDISIFYETAKPYLRYVNNQRGTSTKNEALILDMWQFPDRCEYVYLCDLGYYQFIGDFSIDTRQHEVGDSIIIKRNRLKPKKSTYYSSLHYFGEEGSIQHGHTAEFGDEIH